MPTTAELVAIIAPALSGHANMDDAITLAASMMSAVAWGSQYANGVAYLTAHILTLADRDAAGGGGSAGPVTSERAGDLAVSYGSHNVQLSTADAWLGTTMYGLWFLGLRGQLAVVAPGLAGPVMV